MSGFKLRIERIYQSVTKRIRVDVKRRVDEMWYVCPERLIPFHEVERRSEAVALNAHPNRVDIVGGQLA